jgi:hypothetical protein
VSAFVLLLAAIVGAGVVLIGALRGEAGVVALGTVVCMAVSLTGGAMLCSTRAASRGFQSREGSP